METPNRSKVHQPLRGSIKRILVAAGLATAVAAPAWTTQLPDVAGSSSTGVAPGTEIGLTVPPDTQTPVFLRTAPDAECALQPDFSNVTKPMKLYADGAGYVHFHTHLPQSAEIRLHLECSANGNATTYPLLLRSAATPIEGMPMAETSEPPTPGSEQLPGLTAEELSQISDDELLARGYPPRPDSSAPEQLRQAWLQLVSKPLILLPDHKVSRSDIHHQPPTLVAGLASEHGPNWSGMEAFHGNGSVMEVSANWYVPPLIARCGGQDWDGQEYSSTWVGMDGDLQTDPRATDLVQAGTEQDCFSFFGAYFFSYSTWTEVLPNQPTEQEAGLDINPGDNVQVLAWIGDSQAHQDLHGGNAWFFLWDQTTSQAVRVQTPLGDTQFLGSEAEWIMERPTVDGTYSLLANYGVAWMNFPYALSPGGKWANAKATANLQLSMYNRDVNFPDDNELSDAWWLSPTSIQFGWKNYH